MHIVIALIAKRYDLGRTLLLMMATIMPKAGILKFLIRSKSTEKFEKTAMIKKPCINKLYAMSSIEELTFDVLSLQKTTIEKRIYKMNMGLPSLELA